MSSAKPINPINPFTGFGVYDLVGYLFSGLYILFTLFLTGVLFFAHDLQNLFDILKKTFLDLEINQVQELITFDFFNGILSFTIIITIAYAVGILVSLMIFYLYCSNIWGTKKPKNYPFPNQEKNNGNKSKNEKDWQKNTKNLYLKVFNKMKILTETVEIQDWQNSDWGEMYELIALHSSLGGSIYSALGRTRFVSSIVFSSMLSIILLVVKILVDLILFFCDQPNQEYETLIFFGIASTISIVTTAIILILLKHLFAWDTQSNKTPIYVLLGFCLVIFALTLLKLNSFNYINLEHENCIDWMIPFMFLTIQFLLLVISHKIKKVMVEDYWLYLVIGCQVYFKESGIIENQNIEKPNEL